MSPTRSIQVYLCNGGGALSQPVDFDRLREVARALPGVGAVEDVAAACTDLDGELTGSLREGSADGVVVVGCSEEKLLRHLRSLIESAADAESIPVATADLKWSCHQGEGEATAKGVATARAEALLRQAVTRAALSVPLRVESVATEGDVLVLGEGHAALQLTADLARAGLPVTLVTAESSLGAHSLDTSLSAAEQAALEGLLYDAFDDDAVEVLTETALVACSGEAGSFDVRLQRRSGQDFLRRVGAIVVATEPLLEPQLEALGLPEGNSGVVWTQAQAERALTGEGDALPELSGAQVVIAVGAVEDATVVATERALRLALHLVERGARVSLVTRNLKVAAEGAERLAQQCRGQGVTIHKVASGSAPRFELQGARVVVRLISAALSTELELEADLVVVDERLRPPPALASIAEVLRLETDGAGFVQPENVHLTPVLTNHQAILAVGPARGRFDVVSSLEDAAAAAMTVCQMLDRDVEPRPVRAEVDITACASCLTCLRVCPHGAITFTDVPTIASQFCEGCGQCAAECPMDAIGLVSCSDERIDGEVAAAVVTERPDRSAPVFVVFACHRSATEALRLAEEFGEAMPSGMLVVELPCAGRVDEGHLMAALEGGADGVAVIGCHEGNCRSLRGSDLARERAGRLRRRLEAVGLEPDRVWFGTVAANTRVELTDQLHRFEHQLERLGPSPLRRR